MVRTGGSTILGGHDRPLGKGGPLARVGRLPDRVVHRAPQARDVSGGTSLARPGGGRGGRRAGGSPCPGPAPPAPWAGHDSSWSSKASPPTRKTPSSPSSPAAC